MRGGTVKLRRSDESRNAAQSVTLLEGDRRVRLRCRHRRGAPRRGKSARQGARIFFSFRDEFGQGIRRTSAGAVEPLQHPAWRRATHAVFPSATGRSSMCGSTSTRAPSPCPRSTMRTAGRGAQEWPARAVTDIRHRAKARPSKSCRYAFELSATSVAPARRVRCGRRQPRHRRDRADHCHWRGDAHGRQTSEASMERRKKEGYFLNELAREIERNAPAGRRLGVLRFITAGSVDDGKSTLIGRLAPRYGVQSSGPLAAVGVSRKARPGRIDLSLLTDGLEAERERASPSTSPTAISPRPGASSSSPTLPDTSSTPATWSPARSTPTPL